MDEPEQPAPRREPRSPESKMSRRRFAQRAAGIAAVSLTSASAVVGAGYEPGQSPDAKPEADAAHLGLSPQQIRDAEARLASAIRDFGDRLSADQRGRLRRILLYNEKMLGSIRSFQLANGDPPASVLKDLELG